MVAKIRTTHVGSLPRTPELLEANLKRGELPAAEFQGIGCGGGRRQAAA